MDFRQATPDDVAAIAALHTDSWRRHYRGSLSDAYLDGDVFSDRLAVWTARLAPAPASSAPPATHPLPSAPVAASAVAADQDTDTVVAVDGSDVVGFVHTIMDADATWGALLDNLHVAQHLRGGGVGTQLMARAATAVLARTPPTGLFLWVLDANTAAQGFYEARGGMHEGSEWTEAPGGGAILGLRYAWPDPTILLPPPD